MGLSISGLMQTLFRNPLAGPYVLGLSSGASLGVAAVILEPHFTAMANHYNAIFLRNRIGFKPW
jgi:ABC-type Fe3+-siderophore transport system permease subunit